MYVIREKMFRLAGFAGDVEVLGQAVLHVEGEIMSLHSRLILRDPAGRDVAQVYRSWPRSAPPMRSPSTARTSPRCASTCSAPYTNDSPSTPTMTAGLAGDLLGHEFTIQKDGQTARLSPKAGSA